MPFGPSGFVDQRSIQLSYKRNVYVYSDTTQNFDMTLNRGMSKLSGTPEITAFDSCLSSHYPALAA